jgi:TetR/AcrR family transcriptional regulator
MTESRREREKETRRSLIIDTAEKVFVERGYDLATMDEIARLAEFTKKSVYSYFPTKDELFAAVILRASEVMFSFFEEAFASGKTGLEKISAIGDAYVRFYSEYPVYFRILSLRRYGGTEQSGDYRIKIEKFWSGIFGMMVESFKKGRKDGSLRKDISPETAALHVMSATNGILELVASTQENFSKRYGVSAQEFIRTSMLMLSDSIKNITMK